MLSKPIQHTQQEKSNHIHGVVRKARLPMVRQDNTNRMDTLESHITHQPCPSCNSSDALTINKDGSTKCFSCGDFTPAKGGAVKPANTNGFIKGKVVPIPTRGIHEDTCKRYNYEIGQINGKPCHVANYYDLNKNLVFQKYRFENKDFSAKGTPNFFMGQHLFPNGGKMVCITEGEIDCLTMSQVQGNKWACVSLPSGAQSAKTIFKRQLEWLNQFESVILMFDEDEVGRQAVQEVCHILPAGKAKIARLPLKDANEMLLASRGDELLRAFWEAKPWKPDDIIDGAELYERLTTPKNFESIPYPFLGLNELTHGIRKGEIVTFCAGSGIGKSHVCKVIAHHILKTTDSRMGYIALEESMERTANGIIGLEMGELLHINPPTDTPQYKEAFDNTVGSGRMFLYDHWGSLDSDNLIGHLRYMAKAMDVTHIVLDHLSIVVSGMGDGDERRLIDNTMTKLRALVEETKLGLILVSHLKRPEGKGHEEGATTSLAQLRGSAGIAQLSDMVIGLERNQQDTDNKHRTCLRVLKNRFSGDTGIACNLIYDSNTGLMTEETYVPDGENPF